MGITDGTDRQKSLAIARFTDAQ